jgi:hypothetical protein
MRPLLLILFFVGAVCSSALAAPGCYSAQTLIVGPTFRYPSFLLAENSREYSTARLFSRLENRKVESGYLHNALQSLETVFSNWFFSGRPQSFDQFISQLKGIHFFARGGASGLQHVGIDPFPSLDDRIFGIDLRIRDAYGNLVLDPRETFIWEWNGNIQEHPFSLWYRNWNHRFVQIDGTYHFLQPRLSGLPIEAGPRHYQLIHQNNLQKWMYQYPPAKYVPLYLEQMNRLMNEIQKESQGRRNLRVILPKLAEYHQLFCAAHPFSRVNNSIAMGQINFILETLGLRGIVHGDLDFMALYLDVADYRPHFIRAIVAENPSLARILD